MNNAYKKLVEMGITPDNYPAIIGNKIGWHSKDMQTLCILIEDHFYPNDDLENLIISKGLLKEIAATTGKLITNFGLDIHSHTLKSDPLLSKLKVSKISTL